MKIVDSTPILNTEILGAFEQYWGFGIPKDYRNFLLVYNGGSPKPNCFHFKESRSEGSQVDSFFGIYRHTDNNLLQNIKMYRNKIPLNFLPIANDPGGNLILLFIKGPDRGKVYFWDHEFEAAEGETPDYSNLTLIADSFDEFLANLKDDPS